MTYSEVIVLSDTHGYYDLMIKMFAAEGLTTPEGEWIAPENVRLIHLGDTVDRGPDSAKVFNWLRRLQFKLGPERVVRLVGNHEFAYCGGPTFYGADVPEVNDLIPTMREDGKAGTLKFAEPLVAGGKEWLLVHGGLDPRFETPEEVEYDAKHLAEYINRVGVDYFSRGFDKSWRFAPGLTPEQRTEMEIREGAFSILTGISRVRGGYDSISGVTWCDIVEELIPQSNVLKVNQIVGHRAGDEIYFHPDGKLVGVNVYYGLAQLLRIDLVTGEMTTSGIHGEEEQHGW
jgi:predicted phosphodiesterase